MNPLLEFKPWPKIPRLTNERFHITEKIDGTNACIIVKNKNDIDFSGKHISEYETYKYKIAETKDKVLFAQSRNKFITPNDDNFGFAKWVLENAEELSYLGYGHHFGEWWGKGIGRGYGLTERRFSLFNVGIWNEENKPKCCHVVPYLGNFIFGNLQIEIDYFLTTLIREGSYAVDGFKNPEGIMVYSELAKQYWKVLINK